MPLLLSENDPAASRRMLPNSQDLAASFFRSKMDRKSSGTNGRFNGPIKFVIFWCAILIPASVTRNQLCDLLLDLGPFGVKTNWEDADPKTERFIRNVGKGSSNQVKGKDLSTNSRPKMPKSLGTYQTYHPDRFHPTSPSQWPSVGPAALRWNDAPHERPVGSRRSGMTCSNPCIGLAFLLSKTLNPKSLKA